MHQDRGGVSRSEAIVPDQGRQQLTVWTGSQVIERFWWRGSRSGAGRGGGIRGAPIGCVPWRPMRRLRSRNRDWT